MFSNNQKSLAAVAFALFGTALAVPTPFVGSPSDNSGASNGPECGYCNEAYTDCSLAGQNTGGQTQVNGSPWYTGTLAAPGSTLSLTESHTTGFSWTSGASLGIPDTGISFTGSYSYSSSNAVGEGVSYTCPEGVNGNNDFQCVLQVIPQLFQVSGYLSTTTPEEGVICEFPDQTYTATTPIVDDGGNTSNSIVVCVCPNSDGTTPAGAPSGSVICASCA